MRLNSIRPAPGTKKPRKRVGRGIGCGFGKTCGRGHKGQHARAGGSHKPGFEGGQMPLQRRLPKFGFRSRTAHLVAEVPVGRLSRVDADPIDLKALKAANLIRHDARRVKVIASGALDKPVVLKGLGVTKGARAMVEKAGGKVED